MKRWRWATHCLNIRTFQCQRTNLCPSDKTPATRISQTKRKSEKAKNVLLVEMKYSHMKHMKSDKIKTRQNKTEQDKRSKQTTTAWWRLLGALFECNPFVHAIFIHFIMRFFYSLFAFVVAVVVIIVKIIMKNDFLALFFNLFLFIDNNNKNGRKKKVKVWIFDHLQYHFLFSFFLINWNNILCRFN